MKPMPPKASIIVVAGAVNEGVRLHVEHQVVRDFVMPRADAAIVEDDDLGSPCPLVYGLRIVRHVYFTVGLELVAWLLSARHRQEQST
jgi:hypothetical protein